MELSSTVFVPANEFDAEEAVEFELRQPEVEVVLVVILLWLFDNDFKELERLIDFHRLSNSELVDLLKVSVMIPLLALQDSLNTQLWEWSSFDWSRKSSPFHT